MIKAGTQKQKRWTLDSDQKIILIAFTCTVSLTLLCGAIFESTMALLVGFPIALSISSGILKRFNKSTFEGTLHIAQNGKTFSAFDRKIYRAIVFLSFVISFLASGPIKDAGLGIFLVCFFPYLISTIYCFIRKIPLATFTESTPNSKWEFSKEIPASQSMYSLTPNKNNCYIPGGPTNLLWPGNESMNRH